MHREKTKVIRIGDRLIGGNNPILVQSMTNTKTSDIKDTLTFLNDYVGMIEIPENLNKKVLMEKLEEIYKGCL